MRTMPRKVWHLEGDDGALLESYDSQHSSHLVKLDQIQGKKAMTAMKSLSSETENQVLPHTGLSDTIVSSHYGESE